MACKKDNKQYRFVSKLSEGKRAVFGGAFNMLDTRYADLFSCVCGNKVSVYRCKPGCPSERLQVYVDKDEDEWFYTVAWMAGKDGRPLLAASGSQSVIRVLDVVHKSVFHSLRGHGGAVNEVRGHPREPALLISSSKDESLRVWNCVSGVCALVLAGARGHRNEVLSADVHPFDGRILASCGMDGSIRVWSLHDCWSTVELSKDWAPGDVGTTFPTKIIQYPIISVQNIHTNYVDCLRWLGNFFLTKSVDNEVVLWRWCTRATISTSHHEGSVVDVLQKLPVPECDIWFLKFSLSACCSTLAIGNREGKAFVWDLSASPPALAAQLSTRECKSAIRQTAVSRCGRTIMCCCDDGTVWRWEKGPA